MSKVMWARRKERWLQAVDAVKALAEAWRIAEALDMEAVWCAIAYERRQKDHRFWELQILRVGSDGTNQYFFWRKHKEAGGRSGLGQEGHGRQRC